MIKTISNWIENNQGKWFLIGLTVMILGCGIADSVMLADEEMEISQ